MRMPASKAKEFQATCSTMLGLFDLPLPPIQVCPTSPQLRFVSENICFGLLERAAKRKPPNPVVLCLGTSIVSSFRQEATGPPQLATVGLSSNGVQREPQVNELGHSR